MSCPMCHERQLDPIYRATGIPIFQNKVYPTRDQAEHAALGDVTLVQCRRCTFAFNSSFDPGLMDYDDEYQNEQALSSRFDRHLDEIVERLVASGFGNKKIVEIGCGKGAFLEKLWASGIDASGIDPAYEGDDGRVIKDLFKREHSSKLQADLIVLRHTLEHVADPLRFLAEIAETTDRRPAIFIEVPSLEWIIEKNAFWDVFYEHCNYFNASALKNLFDDPDHGFLFGGQYMFVLAPLSGLRSRAEPVDTSGRTIRPLFASVVEEYQRFVKDHPNLIVWGAGAKGSTFVNVTDPLREWITCLVDINPRKQNRFIGRSGHPVCAPEVVRDLESGDILVMNENYFDEIRSKYDDGRVEFHTL